MVIFIWNHLFSLCFYKADECGWPMLRDFYYFVYFDTGKRMEEHMRKYSGDSGRDGGGRDSVYSFFSGKRCAL